MVLNEKPSTWENKTVTPQPQDVSPESEAAQISIVGPSSASSSACAVVKFKPESSDLTTKVRNRVLKQRHSELGCTKNLMPFSTEVAEARFQDST